MYIKLLSSILTCKGLYLFLNKVFPSTYEYNTLFILQGLFLGQIS